MYLLPPSSHHQFLYRNIPFGVALRLRRICSRDDWLEEQLLEFKHFFQHRRYNNNIINKGFKRAKNIARSDALLPKPSTIDSLQNLMLVMDYHPNFRDIPKLIRDHLSILYESPLMKKVFSKDTTRIRIGFCRTKDLKDLLVPSALPDLNRADTLNSDVVGLVVFNVIVRFVMLATMFYSHQTGSKVWQQEKVIKSDIRYLAAQITLFYCDICLLCNRQCVGSSVNFRARLSNHKSHIKQKKRTCCLVNHFIDNAHDHPLSSLKFVLIEKVSTKTDKFLEQREGHWQAQLWTYEPYAFNAKKEFNSGRIREFLS